MGARGADFSELKPKNALGRLDIGFQSISTSAQGVDSGQIQQVTPNNCFRLGQQIIFCIGIANTIQTAEGLTDNFISRIQLKPWWARPNTEYRQAGAANGSYGSADQWHIIDNQVFLPGPLSGLVNNRYVWMPSPKRLDITEYQTPNPPDASPARNSDSLMLDDLWTFDLQDPNDATYANQFPAPQVPSRWATFFYPAMGYALGFTYDITPSVPLDPGVVVNPNPLVSVSFVVGTLGGTSYQESVG